MSNRRKPKTRLAFVVLLLILSFVGSGVRASVLTVSPALVRMSISAQQPTAETAVALRNDSGTRSSYEIRLVDVDVGTGRLASLATVSARTEKIFKIPVQTIVLEANETKTVVVQALYSDEIAPGGHYAALEIKRIEQATSAKPPLVQIINVGLFLTKEDGAKRELSLLTQKGSGFRVSMPSTYEVALRNDGNVDVTPRGFVALTSGMKEYAKVQFNDTSRPIFAGQSTTYAAPLSGGHLWPGKYKIIVSYRADSGQEQRVFVDEFWYVPVYWLILLCLVVLIFAYRLQKKIVHLKHLRIAENDQGMQEVKRQDDAVSYAAHSKVAKKQRTIIVTEMAREAVRTHTPRNRKKNTSKKQAKKRK